jgi:hypothetical protein
MEWVKGVEQPDGSWTGDYIMDGNYVDWSLSEGFSSEPAENEKYYVDYTIEVPDKVTIIMDTNYIEEGGTDQVWRSPEVKEFSGMSYYSEKDEKAIDFKEVLPPVSDWIGTDRSDLEDIEYMIEDDDLWIKTWIDHDQEAGKYYAVGSLQDRIPKENWFPTIRVGHYYLSQDEYYLFNEPVVMTPTELDMPIAKNINYVPGKYSKAAKLQEGSVNLVKNSGFDSLTETQTLYKLTF